MVLPVSVHVQGVFSGGACVRSARYVRVLVVDTHTHTHCWLCLHRIDKQMYVRVQGDCIESSGCAGCVYTGSTDKFMYACKVIALRAAVVPAVYTQDRQTNVCTRAR
jgi:hypothetical protein